MPLSQCRLWAGTYRDDYSSTQWSVPDTRPVAASPSTWFTGTTDAAVSTTTLPHCPGRQPTPRETASPSHLISGREYSAGVCILGGYRTEPSPCQQERDALLDASLSRATLLCSREWLGLGPLVDLCQGRRGFAGTEVPWMRTYTRLRPRSCDGDHRRLYRHQSGAEAAVYLP